jgi:multidrug efflux pump
VPDVAKVELFGAQAEKVFVEISQKRLAQLGLDMNQVHRADRRAERGGRRRPAERRHENLQVRVGASSTRWTS